MKYMRIVLLFGCLFCISFTPHFGLGQKPQIFYSSIDFAKSIEPTKKIKKISRNFFAFSDDLTVKYEDGTKEKVLKKNIWGYSDSHNNAYRYYDNSFYEIDAVDTTITVYRQTGRWTNIFFSKTLNSEIYKYSKRNLKKYLDEATYQKVLENKRLNKNI